jgi:Ca-activated chloride channel family protein
MTPHHPAGIGPVRRAWSAFVLLLCACALFDGSHGMSVSAAAGPVLSSLQASRTVRVTVVNDKGAPVPDLTTADFEVKEDGKAREVLKVELPAEPLSVALLLDDRGSDINEIRSALVVFVARVQGRAEVSLVSVVPTALTVFDYTSSVPTMMAGIQRLVWRAGPAGGLILSAVADAADELKRREVARPAIVVVTFEGEEFRSHRPANTVLAALERSGATLQVVAVGTPTMRRMNRAAVESGDVQGDDWTVDQGNRNAVLGEGPKQSGGRRQELAVASGLTKALEAVADDLLNQYTVVYAEATDAKPSRKLSVSVKRRGVTVRAPTKIVGS